MNKKECVKAMQTIWDFFFDEPGSIFISACDAGEAIKFMYDLIAEHFDNPPLLFRDVVNDYLTRPIWDNELKEWCIVDNVNLRFKNINLVYIEEWVTREFEDGRYYAREVEEND